MSIRHRIIFLTLSCVVIAVAIIASDPSAEFARNIYESEYGGSIPYQFLVPDNLQADRDYPLIVFLHSSGEVGTDNKIQLVNFPIHWINEENKQAYPAYILAPQCPQSSRWVNSMGKTELPTESMRLTIELIEELLEEHNIDRQRIYVIGISLGGAGVYDIVSRRPDLFAAAVPICGSSSMADVSSMKEVALWIFHGEDDQVVSVSAPRMIVQALEAEGASPRYTEYENAGHGIWGLAYDESEFLPWLFSQQKE
jgi:predicted peptidase